MAKMNPYRRAERVMGVIGNVFVIALYVACGGLLLFIAIVKLGWWTFFWVPAVLAGAALLLVILAFGVSGLDAIARRWRSAKYKWEDKNNA